MTPSDDAPARFLSLADYEAAARQALPPEVYDYYAGGGEDEVTLRGNRAAFGRWFFRPRRLVNVSSVDTSVEVLGRRWPTPVAVAPMAFQRLAHPEGELAVARAAGDAGALMVVSTASTYAIEEIAETASGPLWLQLYVFRDRSITEALIARAVEAGVEAICLTVDVPVQGNRERDTRNRFMLPDGVEMANFRGLAQERFPDTGGSGLEAFIAEQFDPSLTWEAVAWLRSVTDLPIVLKGILTAQDAGRAIDAGADALIVSNHGGRQLDGTLPTLMALPGVVATAGDRVPVLLDGGVRRGTDVAKALALGARGVLVGRPVLWGLAVGGRQGARHVLGIVAAELERTLKLLGRRSVADLDGAVLTPSPFVSEGRV